MKRSSSSILFCSKEVDIMGKNKERRMIMEKKTGNMVQVFINAVEYALKNLSKQGYNKESNKKREQPSNDSCP